MRKPTDHETLTELFRDRGIDFNNTNGNIQAGDAELIFDNTGRLASVNEFEHDMDACEYCLSRSDQIGKIVEDLESAATLNLKDLENLIENLRNLMVDD